MYNKKALILFALLSLFMSIAQPSQSVQAARFEDGLNAQVSRGSYVFGPNDSWNTFLGDSGTDTSADIAVDSSGNIFVVGYSDATWGSPVRGFSGTTYPKPDAFVAKLDPNGTILWSTFLGGPGYDYGTSIALDNSSGAVFITGYSSQNWGIGPVYPFTGGLYDAFVTKLDGTTGNLSWYTFLGGGSSDQGLSIALNSAGEVFVVGDSNSDDEWQGIVAVRPYTFGNMNIDAFAAKLSAAGALDSYTYLGGLGTDNGAGIAIDSSDDLYIAGTSTEDWGDASIVPVNAFAGGSKDAYATKLSGADLSVVWSTFVGGTGTDSGSGVALDGGGNVFVLGTSSSSWGIPARNYGGGASDGFVSTLAAVNGSLSTNTFLGGGGEDKGYGIEYDGSGNIYAIGTSPSSWPASPSGPVRPYTGLTDAFLTILDSSNLALSKNSLLGGSGHDNGYAVAAGGGKIYAAGTSAASWNSPVRSYFGSGTDGYVAMVDMSPPQAVSINCDAPSPVGAIPGNAVTFTVTFSEPVTGVNVGTSNDFSLSTSGFISGVSTSSVSDDILGATRTLTINMGSGSGNLYPKLNDNDSIRDAFGNALGGVGTGTVFNGETITIDKASPTFSAPTRLDNNPTQATSVDYSITYSEVVTGVEATDFSLTSDIPNVGITNVSTSDGQTYTITVSTGDGGTGTEGTIMLLALNDNTIEDLATPANVLSTPSQTGSPTPTNQIYTLDWAAPTVSSFTKINPGTPATYQTSVTVRVTFSENVTDVDLGDFVLVSSGLTSPSLTGVTGGPRYYDVTIDTGTGEGTLGLDVIIDLAGTPITDIATNQLGAGKSSGTLYTIDRTNPDTSISQSPNNPTGATSATFYFSGTDTGGSGSITYQCSLDSAAWVGCTSPKTYDPLSAGSHTFAVRAKDGAGNYDDTPAQYTWVIDAENPDTSITGQPNAITSSDTATFSFTGTDNGSAPENLVFECQLDGGGFSVCVSGLSYTALSDGSHTFQVKAKDEVGNYDATPAEYTWLVLTGYPAVDSITAASPNPTSALSVDFAVTFSREVSNVDITDFNLISTGVLGSSITSVAGSGAAYTVTVNPGKGNGTVKLTLVDDDSIVDAAGNPLGGIGAGNGDFTTGVIYTVKKKLIVKSVGAQDGWILESGENTNKGSTSLNSTATTLFLGDNIVDKQYRSIISFVTKGLPDNAVITKVTLKVKKQGIVGGGDPVSFFGGFMVDLHRGYFNTSASLQAADFQKTYSLATYKTYGPYKPAVKFGWYQINLTTGKNYINKLATAAGVTQIRLRFKLDDNNNDANNYLSLYSGNAPSANRPQLIIEYYVP